MRATNQIQIDYKNLIIDKTLSEQLIIACIAKNEKYINKYAYLKAKWKNCYFEQSYGTNAGEFKKYIEIRNLLHRALNSKYSINELKEMAKQVDKSYLPNNSTVDEIVKLIKSKDYILI